MTTFTFALSMLFACGSSVPAETLPTDVAPAGEAAQPKEESVPKPEPEATHPTPYTAEQIRGEMPTGMVITWQMTALDTVSHQRWDVIHARTDDVLIQYSSAKPDGTAIAKGNEKWSTWEGLQSHAAFPASRTTTETETLDTPWGAVETTKYTVMPGDDESRQAIKRYWFGPDSPGAPLKTTVEIGGKQTFEMKQLTREKP